MTKTKITYAILVVSILCSCTTNSPYPNSWPAIDETLHQDCSKFEGTYKNYNGENYLSDLLGINYVVLNEEQHIQLTIPNENSLELIILEGDKEITNHEISTEKDGYSCDKGIIQLHGIREYFSHPFLIATSRAQIKINIAEDQSIIANIKHKSITIALMILPIASNNIEWRKWEKLN